MNLPNRDEVHVHGHPVRGVEVDAQTRCKHYHQQIDVIAIKFPCCNTYYPCYLCHEEQAGHKATVWPKQRFDEKAVLCGVCGEELSVQSYLDCGSVCPNCSARFNPGCKLHSNFYFET